MNHSPVSAKSDVTTDTNDTVVVQDPLLNKMLDIGADDFIHRIVGYVCFGPKGAWYVRWTDGTSAWELLNPTLSSKLAGRSKTLPPVTSLSISGNNDWVVIFKDGSFATSGFAMSAKLKQALFDEDPKLFIFAPGAGWLLIRQDNTMFWERLPTSLDLLLKRRTPQDPPIQQIAISGFGGWFIRFLDGECEWEAIPRPLEKILIAHVRHADPNIVVALSPVDGLSYFVCVGETAEWVLDGSHLRQALEYAHFKDPQEELPVSIAWEVPKSPLPSVE